MVQKNKLVYGVGINDADYVVQPTENGKRSVCYFYQTWVNLLMRCYSDTYHLKQPTYIGCTVCDEWLTFSNFRNWVETQDYEGKQLDKDLLFLGNKIYSPETCVFTDYVINMLIIDCAATRGDYPLGVDFNKNAGKFRAQCRNPFTKKKKTLGYFNCQKKAHKAWQAKKHEYACQLADLQDDPRVAKALRERYAPDKDWSKR